MNKAKNIFKRSSVTYYYSSIFFPKNVRQDVFDLYAFVREADNCVDDKTKEHCISQFTKNYYKSLDKAGSNEVIDNFIKLSKRHNFESKWIDSFLRSMNQDLHKKTYNSLREVEEYMYGSAEVIGLMMAKILDLPKESYKYASYLGKAMQYANFIRDIDEDNKLGRIYIPQTSLNRYGFINVHKSSIKDRSKFIELIRGEIATYRLWNSEAKKGFGFIPYRSLIPIKTSSDMYEWTINKIEKDPMVVYKSKIKPSKFRVVSMILKNAVFLKFSN